MLYDPNIDAMQFFVREVFPLIRREVPETRLLVVGRDPVPEVVKLHDGRSVIVTGEVPDVALYYRQAAIVVAPIRFGGGTRIKILEAMAHSKAVVATTAGAEGLDVECGRHLLIADSPSEFAQACLKLIRNPLLRQKLGEQGWKLVHDNYQWTSIERRVQQVVLRGGLSAQREAYAT
jgi:glycosyltransferase involved in cell wall biosynthesis